MSAKGYFVTALGQLVLSASARIEGAPTTGWGLLALAILSLTFGWYVLYRSTRATDNKEQ